MEMDAKLVLSIFLMCQLADLHAHTIASSNEYKLLPPTKIDNEPSPDTSPAATITTFTTTDTDKIDETTIKDDNVTDDNKSFHELYEKYDETYNNGSKVADDEDVTDKLAKEDGELPEQVVHSVQSIVKEFKATANKTDVDNEAAKEQHEQLQFGTPEYLPSKDKVFVVLPTKLLEPETKEKPKETTLPTTVVPETTTSTTSTTTEYAKVLDNLIIHNENLPPLLEILAKATTNKMPDTTTTLPTTNPSSTISSTSTTQEPTTTLAPGFLQNIASIFWYTTEQPVSTTDDEQIFDNLVIDLNEEAVEIHAATTRMPEITYSPRPSILQNISNMFWNTFGYQEGGRSLNGATSFLNDTSEITADEAATATPEVGELRMESTGVGEESPVIESLDKIEDLEVQQEFTNDLKTTALDDTEGFVVESEGSQYDPFYEDKLQLVSMQTVVNASTTQDVPVSEKFEATTLKIDLKEKLVKTTESQENLTTTDLYTESETVTYVDEEMGAESEATNSEVEELTTKTKELTEEIMTKDITESDMTALYDNEENFETTTDILKLHYDLTDELLTTTEDSSWNSQHEPKLVELDQYEKDLVEKIIYQQSEYELPALTTLAPFIGDEKMKEFGTYDPGMIIEEHYDVTVNEEEILPKPYEKLLEEKQLLEDELNEYSTVMPDEESHTVTNEELTRVPLYKVPRYRLDDSFNELTTEREALSTPTDLEVYRQLTPTGYVSVVDVLDITKGVQNMVTNYITSVPDDKATNHKPRDEWDDQLAQSSEDDNLTGGSKYRSQDLDETTPQTDEAPTTEMPSESTETGRQLTTDDFIAIGSILDVVTNNTLETMIDSLSNKETEEQLYKELVEVEQALRIADNDTTPEDLGELQQAKTEENETKRLAEDDPDFLGSPRDKKLYEPITEVVTTTIKQSPLNCSQAKEKSKTVKTIKIVEITTEVVSVEFDQAQCNYEVVHTTAEEINLVKKFAKNLSAEKTVGTSKMLVESEDLKLDEVMTKQMETTTDDLDSFLLTAASKIDDELITTDSELRLENEEQKPEITTEMIDTTTVSKKTTKKPSFEDSNSSESSASSSESKSTEGTKIKVKIGKTTRATIPLMEATTSEPKISESYRPTETDENVAAEIFTTENETTDVWQININSPNVSFEEQIKERSIIGETKYKTEETTLATEATISIQKITEIPNHIDPHERLAEDGTEIKKEKIKEEINDYSSIKVTNHKLEETMPTNTETPSQAELNEHSEAAEQNTEIKNDPAVVLQLVTSPPVKITTNSPVNSSKEDIEEYDDRKIEEIKRKNSSEEEDSAQNLDSDEDYEKKTEKVVFRKNMQRSLTLEYETPTTRSLIKDSLDEIQPMDVEYPTEHSIAKKGGVTEIYPNEIFQTNIEFRQPRSSDLETGDQIMLSASTKETMNHLMMADDPESGEQMRADTATASTSSVVLAFFVGSLVFVGGVLFVVSQLRNRFVGAYVLPI